MDLKILYWGAIKKGFLTISGENGRKMLSTKVTDVIKPKEVIFQYNHKIFEKNTKNTFFFVYFLSQKNKSISMKFGESVPCVKMFFRDQNYW